MRTKTYKGWTISFSTPYLGFFASGRAGKVIRKVWVENELVPFSGKWVASEAEAKKYVNEKTK